MFVGRAGGESAGGIEDARQEMNIPGGVEEDLRVTEDPMNGKIDIPLLFEGAVPGGAVLGEVIPGGAGDALDGLQGNIPLAADGLELGKTGGIIGILHHHVVEG